jgi:splicing factor 3B subunit 1
MKDILLKVVRQCVGSSSINPGYIREEVVPPFFTNFF